MTFASKIKLIENLIQSHKELGWKLCLFFWIPILLLASPLLLMIYSSKQTIKWFTDFNWVFPYGGGLGSTACVIVSNVMRATIMFAPIYFCLIIMHRISRQNSISEKLIYFFPTASIALAFIAIYFPNRPISIINTMGLTPRREDALVWTLFIWFMVITLSALLLYPKTRQSFLWFIYGLIILTALVGCSAR